MKRSRARRPYLRTSRRLGALTDAAGQARPTDAARPAVEPLEPRQLLFSLTVDAAADAADGVTDGYGTVTANFGYVLPYLSTDEVVDTGATGEQILEDFSGVLPDGATSVGIPTGTQFESNFSVDHNLTNVAVNARVAVDTQDVGGVLTPIPDTDSLRLRFSTVGEFIELSLRADEGSSIRLPVSNLAFDLGGGGLVSRDNYRITALLGGVEQVVNITDGASGRISVSQIGDSITVFDTVRIELVSELPLPGFDDFTIDNVETTTTAGAFADLIDNRIFGAEVSFRAPVGATATFLDLYGRNIRQTLALGIPDAAEIALVDLNDDGVPDFNDGIGQIIIEGTDERSSFVMFGANITANDDFVGGFEFERLNDINGLSGEFLEAGFAHGLGIDGGGTLVFTGVPEFGASVVVGSPIVRDLNAYNPQGVSLPQASGQLALLTNDGLFNSADQGIIVRSDASGNGGSIGTLSVHGLMYGTYRVENFAERIGFGHLYGSLDVGGDLGDLTIAGDAGIWSVNSGTDRSSLLSLDEMYLTGSTITVGRTLGEIAAGSRILSDVIVEGDLADSTGRPAGENLVYTEREVVYPIDPAIQEPDQVLVGNILASVAEDDGFGTALLFSDTLFRNDSLQSSEFLGSAGSGIIVNGQLGYLGPINSFEDGVDVYSFAVDGTSDIVIELGAVAANALNVRVLNADGETVAAVEGSDPITGPFRSSQLVFSPDAPGVYFLSISDATITGVFDGEFASGIDYRFVITGLAPVTLGSYRAGHGLDVTPATILGSFGPVESQAAALGGSVGWYRVGTGRAGADGGEDVGASNSFSSDGVETLLLSATSGTFSARDRIYSFSAGHDIGSVTSRVVTVIAGTDVAEVSTGRSPLIGGTAGRDGDLNFFSLEAGGSIGVVDVPGGIGVDSDTSPVTFLGGTVSFRTGLNGGPGDISVFTVGGIVNGGVLSIRTSDGSTIGLLTISEDLLFDDTVDGFVGIEGTGGVGRDNNGVELLTGSGSDVRFFYTPLLDLLSAADAATQFGGGLGAAEFIDDAGSRLRVSITDADPVDGEEPDDDTINSGLVRFLPVDFSEGGVVASIEVDLSAGGVLNLSGLTGLGDAISIGRIIVRNAAEGSGIRISGNVEIDVWSIVQEDGEQLAFIENTTPGGDIVAIDVIGVDRVTIRSGDLGRTEVPAWGPRLIGPNLGISAGENQTPLGTIGIPAEAIAPLGDWNGAAFRPLTDFNFNGGNGYGDDIGLPFDQFLNGLIARTGSVSLVSVGGAIGDVILQGGAGIDGGRLQSVVADADGVVPLGEFHGIFGNIYADFISSVNIGRGLAANPQSPLARSSIVANDDIQQITGNRAGAFISGLVAAFNADPATEIADPDAPDTGDGADGTILIGRNGINTIRLTGGGGILDTDIIGGSISSFWAPQVGVALNGFIFSGQLWDIDITRGDIARTAIRVNDARNINIRDGFWDASLLRVRGDLNFITASGYRNSTLEGEDREFRQSLIAVSGDLRTIQTNNRAGDFVDTRVDVLGDVTGAIEASRFIRAQIDVDNTVQRVEGFVSMLSSTITAGRIVLARFGEALVNSSFVVSGPLESLTSGGRIQGSRIEVTGPDGVINAITAQDLLQAEIIASGPIRNIESRDSDVDAVITTTTARGTLDRVRAGRDLILTTDLAASVGTLTAGRHLGEFGVANVIDIQGNLGAVTIGGQLFSDLRVGGAMTGLINIGDGTIAYDESRPSDGRLEAFGSINRVSILYDFAGEIVSHSGSLVFIEITDGSLLTGASISAFDGDLGGVRIINGNLYGDIYTDGVLFSVEVVASEGGVFGDAGVNPNRLLGADTTIDAELLAIRSDLPPGIGTTALLDGPRIEAGQNIGSVIIGGSAYEITIIAGGAIGFVTIGGDLAVDNATASVNSGAGQLVRGNLIAGGDSVFNVTAGGAIRHTWVLAGVTDFGADGLPGGIGVNADDGRAGWVELVSAGAAPSFAGGFSGQADPLAAMADNVFSAGVSAGADGVYNTADDLIRPGASFIRFLTTSGPVVRTTAYSDAFGAVDDRFSPTGGNRSDLGYEDAFVLGVNPGTSDAVLAATLTEADVSSGAFETILDLPGGTQRVVLRFSADAGDPSDRFFYQLIGSQLTVAFSNTEFDASIEIVSQLRTLGDGGEVIWVNGGTLTDLHVTGVDDASIGSLSVTANLDGDSFIFVDAYAELISVGGTFSGTGGIVVGHNATRIVTGTYNASVINALSLAFLEVNGTLGPTTSDTQAEARAADGFVYGVDVVSAGFITISGDFRARINVERFAGDITITGAVDNALFRVGASMGTLALGSVSESRLTIGDNATRLTTSGDVFDSSIMIGGDLGADADFDARTEARIAVLGAVVDPFLANDRVSTGSLGSASFGGEFLESDLVEGALRGGSIAEESGDIGDGDGFFGTSDDRVAKGRGSIGNVTISGSQVGSSFNSESYRISSTGTVGRVLLAGQTVVQGLDLGNFRVEQDETIAEPILVESLRVDEASRIYTARIAFNQPMDAASLLQAGALRVTELATGALVAPGTDTYALEYDDANNTLLVRFSRAITERDLADPGPGPGAYRFDLDGDLVRAAVVRARLDGDGDGTVEASDDFSADDFVGDVGDRFTAGSFPITSGVGLGTADFYAPADLNTVLDSNVTPDGLPDANSVFTIRGSIGDHPDHDASGFRLGADLDLYELTLQAGQILRLGQLTGEAVNASVRLIAPDQFSESGLFSSPFASGLPVAFVEPDARELSTPQAFYIRQTGTYTLAVASNSIFAATTASTAGVVNPNTAPGSLGSYAFDVEIFDDGDSGFAGGTDSSDGAAIVNAPDRSAFVILDEMGNFQSFDFGRTVVRDGYTFSLSGDPANPEVVGTNGEGITSTRTVSAEGVNVLTTRVESSLGGGGRPGLQEQVSADLDVFHLNNRNPLPEGTQLRFTFKASEIGSDLGSRDRLLELRSLIENVQVGFFDTTEAFTGATELDRLEGAELVFSPTDLNAALLGEPNTTIASGPNATYGYDANGDFFIDFLTPGPGPRSYAFYVQGVFETDYVFEVTQQPFTGTFVERSQNVLLELDGGTIDWLLTGDRSINVAPFSAETLAFSGEIDGTPVLDLIINGDGQTVGVVDRLNAIFQSEGLDVTFATSPAAFEFESFSTVFVTSSPDPVGQVLPTSFAGETIAELSGLNVNPFGYSEHSDPFNSDRDDEAVVFAPPLSLFGFSSSREGIEDFNDSLTAAISRRVGELLGLRLTGDDLGFGDPFAADSVSTVPLFGEFDIPDPGTARPLTTRFDELLSQDFFIGRQDSGSLLDRILSTP
ncbi:MAG: hypothetical protein AAGG07_00200 [Planctomycetota bacterium]